MSLERKDVKNIAHLARIEVSEAETELALAQLNGILGLIDELAAVPTAGVQPMAHALDVAQRLRDDVVTESNRRDAYLANAPQAEAGLFLVPQVVSK